MTQLTPEVGVHNRRLQRGGDGIRPAEDIRGCAMILQETIFPIPGYSERDAGFEIRHWPKSEFRFSLRNIEAAGFSEEVHPPSIEGRMNAKGLAQELEDKTGDIHGGYGKAQARWRHGEHVRDD